MSVAVLDRSTVGGFERSDYHDRFAAAYDTFYRQRDVDGEVEHALGLLQLADRSSGVRVLDFGCGTGSHAFAMARRGYEVVGVDTSPAMITQALAKAQTTRGQDVEFVHPECDGGWFDATGVKFDGVVSFFNVLNCMESAEAMTRALSTIRHCMTDGACAYLEVWNGAAAFADLPRPDVRHFRIEGVPPREMIRITIPEACRIEQRCTLRYRVLELDASRGNYTEFESVHRLHFLTPVQYRHMFALAGLEIVDEFPKGRPGTRIAEQDWYIAYVVRRA